MVIIKLTKRIGFDSNDKEIVETKTYFAPAPKALVVRNAAEMAEKLNTNQLSLADLDMMADFIVKLFGNKFSVDDFWNGIDADKVLSTVFNCINQVLGEMQGHLNAIPNQKAE